MKKNIDPSVFIADGARIIGNVTIGKNSSVWFNAVIRADNQQVVIGSGSNIQDNAVLHMDLGYPLYIGNNVTIGHGAIVHGCRVEDNCILGMGCIVMNGAHIGSGSIIGAGALVTENTIIPENSIVLGSPGKVKREATESDQKMIEDNAIHYVEMAKDYLNKK